jgi:hypothetical protein
MMNHRQSNKNLQVIVLQTIVRAMPQLKPWLVVTANTEGIVYLNGSVPNRDECKRAVELSHSVSGVTDVFCHLGVKA